ncbi:MAG TPA: hypothetical protein VD928_01295 [Candidatus Paceibacterota bacterium]|nr:hypothetical protein [Candidatus Paceibacterota bacterium]
MCIYVALVFILSEEAASSGNPFERAERPVIAPLGVNELSHAVWRICATPTIVDQVENATFLFPIRPTVVFPCRYIFNLEVDFHDTIPVDY